MERFLKIPRRTFLHLVRLARREKCPSLLPVYLALLYHADRIGRCFPGYRRIQALSGIGSRKTLTKAIAILERYGLLRAERERGEVNRYVLGGSPSEPGWFTEETRVVHSVNQGGSPSEPELDPFNYNQLTRPKELKKGERARDGKRKLSGMPEDPKLDVEYYLF